MTDRLAAKTREYEQLLAAATAETTVDRDHGAESVAAGEECLEMAVAYLDDGRHFLDDDDLPNALAAFSYGHGWLDAGIRIGVLTAEVTED